VLGIWWRGLTAIGAACGLAVGGLASGTAVTLAIAGVVDEHALGGWPAIMIGYPAAVSVPLAFATMIVVSRLTRNAVPPDVAQTFARMHVPERLGMGIERVPRG
jgi:Na+(H+)/acetate symporter ActP